MADHPFPLAGLAADPSLEAAAEDYADAMKSLRATHKLSDEDGFFSQAGAGGWTPWKRPRLKLGDVSSHEAIEDAILLRRCEDALDSFRAFLDPASAGVVGLRLSWVHSTWGGASAMVEITARTWARTSSSSRFRVRVDAAAKTFPVARDVLSAFGSNPFLPPPENGADILVVSVEESTRYRGFGFNSYDRLSLNVESARVDEDSAARNALRQAVFLGALRDGIADAGDFLISGFEIKPARASERKFDARRTVQNTLVSAGLAASATGGERQAWIDRVEGRKSA